MPYTRRPKPLPKRPIAKTKKDADQDKRIVKMQRQLSSMKPEMKYVDYFNATTAPVGGFLGFSFCLLAQGDDFNQRIGEEVRAKYLDIAITVTRLATLNTGAVRFLVIWDKQNNGETIFNPLASLSLDQGLLDNTTITNEAICPFNDRCSERYSILYQKLLVFNPSEPTCQEGKVFKKRIPLSNTIIKYSDSGATAASLVSRNLLVLYYGMGSANYTHNTSGRFHYTDN